MDLLIRHETTYTYDEPVDHGLQRLRLTPKNASTQRIAAWATDIEGGTKQLDFNDHFGNSTELVSIDPGVESLRVVATGRVQTTDTNGVVATAPGLAPLWLFTRATPLTEAGPAVIELADDFADYPDGAIAQAHDLSRRIATDVTYEGGHTTSTDTAEHALTEGFGVCQDHAHVFLACARQLGLAARYVSGYLFMEETTEQDATHAWVEIWIEGLGWIGLDPSNGISPDERYVRIATGLDYEDASPISGIRFGDGDEQLTVSLRVENRAAASAPAPASSQSQSQSQSPSASQTQAQADESEPDESVAD